ncbi:hypothetical protein TKK_0013189 [Trichogramma kaykai]
MKPISGETVLSIVHGPATTGHIKEMSMFLRRPIDVWAKDRLMLFGSEPRDPDRHPLNCAFDVVSDQTGYPASALRQVAVQRMLAKLYQSRLRGHDYHVQCPACGISGGRVWFREHVRNLINSSTSYQGHAHVNVERLRCQFHCECAEPWQYTMNNDISRVRCMGRYLEIFPLSPNEEERTLFKSDRDLEDILLQLLNSEDGTKAYDCLFWKDKPSCIDSHQMLQQEVIYYADPLRRIASFEFFHRSGILENEGYRREIEELRELPECNSFVVWAQDTELIPGLSLWDMIQLKPEQGQQRLEY